MQVEVELRHFVGRCKGMLVTQPVDVVYLKRGEDFLKVGHIRRAQGGVLLFCRYIANEELRKAITAAVVAARKDSEAGDAAPFSAMIPNPQEVKSYLKGEIKRKKKHFLPIVGPDGKAIAKETL